MSTIIINKNLTDKQKAVGIRAKAYVADANAKFLVTVSVINGKGAILPETLKFGDGKYKQVIKLTDDFKNEIAKAFKDNDRVWYKDPQVNAECVTPKITFDTNLQKSQLDSGIIAKATIDLGYATLSDYTIFKNEKELHGATPKNSNIPVYALNANLEAMILCKAEEEVLNSTPVANASDEDIDFGTEEVKAEEKVAVNEEVFPICDEQLPF